MKTTGLNHIILTISDVAKSRAFYEGLLGFEAQDFDNGFYFISGGIEFFFFPSRNPIPNDRFTEFRIGLDHLSFAAPNEEELDHLAERLLRAGVDTKGVETFRTGNRYVAFRDPDNIQLEYWLPKKRISGD